MVPSFAISERGVPFEHTYCALSTIWFHYANRHQIGCVEVYRSVERMAMVVLATPDGMQYIIIAERDEVFMVLYKSRCGFRF